MALPAQPDGAGVSALAQLPLLPFLAASPGPALVLPLSPLAHALRARQHAPSPLKTPLWSAHQPQAAANAAAATGSQGSAKPAIKRFRSNSDATPTLSQLHDQGPGTEVIRGIEGLNVKTPLGAASETFPDSGNAGDGGDYFSLDSLPESSAAPPIDVRRPSSASSSEASSADTLLSVSPIDGAGSPLTPLDDDESSPSAPSAGIKPAADTATFNPLNPVYRNEAWRNLETAPPVRVAAAAAPSTFGAAAATLSRGDLRRRGKRRRASHEEEGDVLMGSIPPAPGFERTGSGGRSATPLGRVDEEDEQPYEMDTDDDVSSGSVSGAETETETDAATTDFPDDDDDESGDPYAFLSHDDQATLLAFVLDLVEDRDNGYPGMPACSSDNPSPKTLSPATTPGLADGAAPRWTSAPSPVSSLRTIMPVKRRPASQLPQTIRLGDHVVSATVVPFTPVLGTPSADTPLDASAASPFGAHASSASGFVILTMPPPAPATSPLPQHWPPSGSSSAPRASTSSSARHPPPAQASTITARDVGKIYQSPTTTTETRVGSLAAAAAAAASGSNGSLAAQGLVFPLGAHEDPWVRALGDSEMGRRIRTHPWHETPLGPISGWQPELKTMVANILASPFRECILWGDKACVPFLPRRVLAASARPRSPRALRHCPRWTARLMTSPARAGRRLSSSTTTCTSRRPASSTLRSSVSSAARAGPKSGTA